MRVLQAGAYGEDVKALQIELQKRGFNVGIIDGWYGEMTKTAVIALQTQMGLVQDGVAGLNTLKALGMVGEPEKTMPKFLVLHCSATNGYSEGWSAEAICNFHKKTLGWSRCGYNWIIELDGTIKMTHPIDLHDGFQPFEMSFGVAEYNQICINLNYLGGINNNNQPEDTRTQKQYNSMLSKCFEIIQLCPDIKIIGHNQLHNKACPCFWVPDFLREIQIPEKHVDDRDPFGYANYLRNINKNIVRRK